MKLLKMAINNFLSIEDIELVFDKPGLVLILGKNLDNPAFNSNGSGKSSLWYALVYCLYNKVPRDVAPLREGQDSCSVSVTLDPEDGSEPVSIVRTYANKKSQVRISTESKYSLVTAKDKKDTDAQIIDWLGLSYQLFANSVYFGKSLSDLFMLSNDAERKEILETILSIVSFDKAQETAKTQKKAQENKKIVYESEINIGLGRIAEATASLEKYKEDYQKTQQLYNDAYPECLAVIASCNDTIIECNSDIVKLNTDLSKKEVDQRKSLATLLDVKDKKILACKLEIRVLSATSVEQKAKEHAAITADFNETVNDCEFDISKTRDERTDVDGKILALERSTYLLNAKITEAQALLKDFTETDVSVPCTKCRQQVPHEHIEAQQKGIKEDLVKYALSVQVEDTELTSLKNRKSALNSYLNTLASEKSAAQRTYNVDISRLNEKYVNLTAEVTKDIQVQIDTINENYNLDYQELINIFNSVKLSLVGLIATAKANLLEAENNKSFFSKKIQELEEKIAKLKSDVDLQESKILDHEKKNAEKATDIKKLTAELEILEFWISAFSASGIKSFVLENALPYLTDRANHYSGFLTGGMITVEFLPFSKTKTTDKVKEKIDIKITNTCGGSSYQASSDGEKRRIDLAILLAFQDLLLAQSIRKWNLLIFDEIFDALDDSGIEAVVDLLRTMNDKNIFVISHNDTLKKYFDEAIVVHKKNGISYLC